MRLVAPVAALAAVYALAIASAAPIDLAAGAIAGWAALRGLGIGAGVAPLGEVVRRAAAFPVFAWAVAGHVVAGTVHVAATVLGLRSRPAGIVAVPMEERGPTGVAVAALALTLSPGEVLVALDWKRRQMLIHVMDASDPEAVRDQHHRMYQRYQRRVFP